MFSIKSNSVHSQIDQLLLSGQATTGYEAEEIFLDAHLSELVRLVTELGDREFEEHEAIKLLMAHGSRQWEDALR